MLEAFSERPLCKKVIGASSTGSNSWRQQLCAYRHRSWLPRPSSSGTSSRAAVARNAQSAQRRSRATGQTIELKMVLSDPQLRSLREQLLQATGEEDAALQEVPKGSKGLFGTASLISMPVFYITDRARISGGSFGGELRDQGVAYGKSVVTLDTAMGCEST